MPKNRLEAFSDGVIAILITIMVLELHTPQGTSWHALREEAPGLLAYVLSFLYLGIYWNNHHHMLAAASRVSGTALWANLHLLFWLSLVPFATAWMSENHFPAIPTAVYGLVLLAAALAYYGLQTALLRTEDQHSVLRAAVGIDVKGKVSPLLYCVGVVLCFVDRWLGLAVYVAVALIWLVPDRRVERTLSAAQAGSSERLDTRVPLPSGGNASPQAPGPGTGAWHWHNAGRGASSPLASSRAFTMRRVGSTSGLRHLATIRMVTIHSHGAGTHG